MESVVINLSRGQSCVIDKSDEPIVLAWPYKWYLGTKGYAVASAGGSRGKQRKALMHRLLLGFPSGYVDHANGDKLDNRRSNLRACTPAQNSANRRSSNPHKFKGVVFREYMNRFEANIQCGRKRYYLGIFKTAVEAAAAYNEAAKEMFGEFASLNDI